MTSPASFQIILASGSPRRRELLAQTGLPFSVQTAAVVELDAQTAPHLAPGELALANARLKARAVADQVLGESTLALEQTSQTSWVLGADTIVVVPSCGNLGKGLDKAPRILGKPESRAQAADFLRLLAGREHQVVTGLVLIANGEEIETWTETTTVEFWPVTEAQIEAYLDAVPVLDKAGAYALQERGDDLVRKVRGSSTNVIGLPMESLTRKLVHYRLLHTPETVF